MAMPTERELATRIRALTEKAIQALKDNQPVRYYDREEELKRLWRTYSLIAFTKARP